MNTTGHAQQDDEPVPVELLATEFGGHTGAPASVPAPALASGPWAYLHRPVDPTPRPD